MFVYARNNIKLNYKWFILLQDLMETALEFMKLEKVELGGIKGKVLSQQVVNIFEEFHAQYKVFTDSTYDCLDPNDPVSISSSSLLMCVILTLIELILGRTDKMKVYSTIT